MCECWCLCCHQSFYSMNNNTINEEKCQKQKKETNKTNKTVFNVYCSRAIGM